MQKEVSRHPDVEIWGVLAALAEQRQDVVILTIHQTTEVWADSDLV